MGIARGAEERAERQMDSQEHSLTFPRCPVLRGMAPGPSAWGKYRRPLAGPIGPAHLPGETGRSQWMGSCWPCDEGINVSPASKCREGGVRRAVPEELGTLTRALATPRRKWEQVG